MKHTYCVLILFLNCFLNVPLRAQVTPSALRSDPIQDALIKKTVGFDSLILINWASSQKDDQMLRGFGFEGEKLVKVEIHLKQLPKSDDLVVEKVVKDKGGNKKLDELMKTNFSKTPFFNDDSLSLNKRKGKVIMSVSDGREYSIVHIIPSAKRLYLKQSYMPEYYQALAPTSDRSVFIELFNKLNGLLD